MTAFSSNTLPVEHVPIEAMVHAYNDAVAEIVEGYRLLDSAQQRLTAAFQASSYRFGTNPRENEGGVGTAAADRVIDRIHRAALRALIERMAIQPMLSDRKWKELQDQLERGKREDLPSITEQSLAAMAEGIAQNLGSYFIEAVREVYDFLRPHPSWRGEYKTNNKWELGRKVIVRGIERSYGTRPFRVAYGYQQNITAIDNVFHYLDGRPRPEGTLYGPLTDAILQSADGVGETGYFKFRCFQNGNLHLGFKRLDLVQRLNEVAGGDKLKPRDGFADDTGVPACA